MTSSTFFKACLVALSILFSSITLIWRFISSKQSKALVPLEKKEIIVCNSWEQFVRAPTALLGTGVVTTALSALYLYPQSSFSPPVNTLQVPIFDFFKVSVAVICLAGFTFCGSRILCQNSQNEEEILPPSYPEQQKKILLSHHLEYEEIQDANSLLTEEKLKEYCREIQSGRFADQLKIPGFICIQSRFNYNSSIYQDVHVVLKKMSPDVFRVLDIVKEKIAISSFGLNDVLAEQLIENKMVFPHIKDVDFTFTNFGTSPRLKEIFPNAETYRIKVKCEPEYQDLLMQKCLQELDVNHLNLALKGMVTDKTLECISGRFDLKGIDVKQAGCISSEALTNFVKSTPNLQLVVGNCNTTTDILDELIDREITYLDLIKTCFEKKDVKKLVPLAPKLKVLRIGREEGSPAFKKIERMEIPSVRYEFRSK